MWLTNILKRFKFDNKLFEIGINEIVKQLIKLNIKDKFELLKQLQNQLETKFKNFKPLLKLIPKVLNILNDQINIVSATINDGLIESIGKKIINFYNQNF